MNKNTLYAIGLVAGYILYLVANYKISEKIGEKLVDLVFTNKK